MNIRGRHPASFGSFAFHPKVAGNGFTYTRTVSLALAGYFLGWFFY